MEAFKDFYVDYDFLIEGRVDRYAVMFDEFDSDYSEIVREVITTFKKDDRIIWMLRYHKADAYSRLTDELDEKSASRFDKYVKRFPYVASDFTQTNHIFKTMSHFFAMTEVKRIQNFVFDEQDFGKVNDKFTDWEGNWQMNRSDDSQLIDITDELQEGTIEELIDFGNGYKWFDLKRPRCALEGGAMGHCGNSAEYREEDTILSLRKVSTDRKTKKVTSKPFLTFILRSTKNDLDDEFGDDYKFLGEMKGRANKKPAKKYHRYIVDLLKYRGDDGEYLVSEVRGGGYAPEGNFSIGDLDLEMMKDLEKERPYMVTERDKLESEHGIEEGFNLWMQRSDGFGDFRGTDTDAYGNVSYVVGYDVLDDVKDRAIVEISDLVDATDDDSDVNLTPIDTDIATKIINKLSQRSVDYIMDAMDMTGSSAGELAEVVFDTNTAIGKVFVNKYSEVANRESHDEIFDLIEHAILTCDVGVVIQTDYDQESELIDAELRIVRDEHIPSSDVNIAFRKDELDRLINSYHYDWEDTIMVNDIQFDKGDLEDLSTIKSKEGIAEVASFLDEYVNEL